MLRRARVERLLDEPVEADVLVAPRRQVAARDLDQVGHELGELLALLDHVGEQPVAVLLVERAACEQHLDVRAQARDRRAQLVRGVRDELALRADRVVERCRDLSSRSSISLKRVASWPTSSSAWTAMRWLRSSVSPIICAVR